jgi:hypothetical protein
MNVEITIDKKWFEENKSKLIYVDKYDDDKTPLYQIVLNENNQEKLIDEDGNIKISVYNSVLNFTAIEDKVEPETLISLAQIITKYYNRAKTAFESLK